MTPSQTAHPTEGEKTETLEALERDARQLWGTRQEACALYGADIPMPTLAVPVDLLCKLLSQLVRPQGEEGLREALAKLVRNKDAFDASGSGNQADAYYCLVKGCDADWNAARAALSNQVDQEPGVNSMNGDLSVYKDANS